MVRGAYVLSGALLTFVCDSVRGAPLERRGLLPYYELGSTALQLRVNNRNEVGGEVPFSVLTSGRGVEGSLGA